MLSFITKPCPECNDRMHFQFQTVVTLDFVKQTVEQAVILVWLCDYCIHEEEF